VFGGADARCVDARLGRLSAVADQAVVRLGRAGVLVDDRLGARQLDGRGVGRSRERDRCERAHGEREDHGVGRRDARAGETAAGRQLHGHTLRLRRGRAIGASVDVRTHGGGFLTPG
jgi:hypothetical protein